jgi:hypothetical protein
MKLGKIIVITLVIIVVVSIIYILNNKIITNTDSFEISNTNSLAISNRSEKPIERTQLYISLFLDNLDSVIQKLTDPDINYEPKRIDIIKYSDMLL